MSGVGALTGNKKLQKWGGILSLAGGVAGLATGAWASTASSVAGDAARESFRGLEYAAQGASEAAGAARGLADVTGTLAQVNAGVSDIGIGATNTGAVPMTPGINPAAPGITPPSVPAGMPSSVNLGSQGGTMQTMTPNSGGSMLSSIGDKVKPAFDWMEKNPRITQAGAGLLQSGLSGYAQQEQIKEQMQMMEDQRDRARKRLSDSVQGVQVPVYQRKGG